MKKMMEWVPVVGNGSEPRPRSDTDLDGPALNRKRRP